MLFSRKLEERSSQCFTLFVVLCAIWYHSYNLKYAKNTHGGVLLLVKLEASACNFSKSNTPPWVFFTFFKLHEWYQIAQSTTYCFSFFSVIATTLLLVFRTYCTQCFNCSNSLVPLPFLLHNYIGRYNQMEIVKP